MGAEDEPNLVHGLGMGEGLERGGMVLRARFMEELVKLLPEDCAEFGKTFTRMEEADDFVKLYFSDGTTAKVDALITCDGIRSAVRKRLLGEKPSASKAIFVGKDVYRGLLDMDAAIAAVGQELATNSQAYMGKGGHVVTYPIENGRILNVLAFQQAKEEAWKHQKWVAESSNEELMRDFEGWGQCVQNLVELCTKPQIWALFDMPPAPTYSAQLATLLGDAAHASLSHAGADAGMAIEDALYIGSVEDIPAVFATYDKIRRPRTQMLVKFSRESGMISELNLPGVAEDTEKLEARLENTQRWIWDINLDRHIYEAEMDLVASR